MTKPLGNEENQQLWRKIVSELAFYAIPDKFSPAEAKRFLKLHGSYPENFINLVKYSQFFSRHSVEALSKTQIMIEKMEASIEKLFDPEINLAHLNYEIGEDPEFDNIKAEFETIFSEADWDGTICNLKEIIGKDLLKKIKNYTENKKSQNKKRVSHQSLYEMQFNPKVNEDESFDELEELLQFRSSIVEKEENARKKLNYDEFFCDDILDECFKNSEPRLEDFEKFEKWIEGVVAEDKRFILNETALFAIIKAAIRLKRENFICFFYQNYGFFSDYIVHPLLGVEMARIITESELEGDKADAIFNVLYLCSNYFGDMKSNKSLGPLDWPTVPELILKAYLSQGDITRAYTVNFM